MNTSRVTLICAISAALAHPLTAVGQSIDLPYRSGVEIEYEVMPGDTPSEITAEMVREDIQWKHIAGVNGIPANAIVKPGQVVRIPVTWLKYGAKFAAVDSISGAVNVNGKPADKHSKFSENDAIETGNDGIVVIVLPDGTEMSIAPSSVVRIERLRQYFDGDTVDARIRLERGQMESNSPEIKVSGPNNNRRRDIRIHTPKATAAVRGTQFRITESGEVAASSVLTGKVNWSAKSGAAALKKGFGASADAQGSVTPPEVLLAAPTVRAPAETQRTTSVLVPFDPIPGATSYRVKIASNTKFSDYLSEMTVTEPVVKLDTQRDGNHFIAVRGVSKNGVGGLDGVGKVTIEARPIAPALQSPENQSVDVASNAILEWLDAPQASRYRLQVSDSPGFENILVDQPVSATRFTYEPERARVPVRRFWRVAAVDGWTTGPFTAAKEFSLAVQGPTPKTRTESNGDVVITWENLPANGYTVLLSGAALASGETRKIDSTEAKTVVKGLEPGNYKVSVIARYDQDLTSTESEATSFNITFAWTDSTGEIVETLDGPLQRQK